ncbi:MAG: L,D-transpeptidase [Hyphomicrobiaceae bacterium]|nr:L,D-transpeptidase [Hyphomicrobiaceae bacterium]
MITTTRAATATLALIGLAATLLLVSPAAVDHAHAQPAAGSNGKGRRLVTVSSTLEPGSVVVSLADRRLYHVRETGKAVSYPIATPRDQDVWDGTQIVTAKRENPAWRPTPEMIRDNPRLPTFVPGGHPFNPMGARALYLGHTYYRIHGTDAPWLVGRNVSKGCIRMHNEHVTELYEAIPLGARVTVTRRSIPSPEPRMADREGAERRPDRTAQRRGWW